MKALVFAPHAGIWVHAFPEALTIDALRPDHEVVYITCDGGFASLCVTMASTGLTADSPAAEKDVVCRSCRRNRDLLRRGFAFPGYSFESVLMSNDYQRAEALADTATPTDIAMFEVDGVRVGRATLYEYLIKHKKSNLDISVEEWPRFRPSLVNALRSLIAANLILDREKPDRVFTYNSLYSVNAMWRAAATQRDIPSYFLHAGVGLKDRLHTMIVGRGSSLAWANQLIAAWPRYRDVPCTDAELAAVTDHFEQLFLGRSVFAYSSAKTTARDIRGVFGIHRDQKLLVATMSSYDEYIAAVAIGEMPAQSRLFPTQIEWIRALVTWLRQRPDLFLVVRVHPREFPNKREGTKSEHAQQLERALSDLPANVRVNWPADQLSIYDLAEHADVFLNAWSSAGREMALLGLPVVVYGPELLLYPADLNYVGTTQLEYFAAIERALRDGWSFDRVRRAFRWCVLEMRRSIVDIGDGFSRSEEPPRALLARVTNAVLARTFLRERWEVWSRPARLRNASKVAATIETARPTLLPEYAYSDTDEAAETRALQAQLARLARAFSLDSPLRKHLSMFYVMPSDTADALG